MKSFLLTAIGFCFIGNMSMASAMPSVNISHPDYPNLSVIEFLKLSGKDIQKLTGKKMSLGKRISFGMLKAKMRKAVKKDPAITVHSFMASQKKGSPGGVVLLVLLVAVLFFFLLFLVLYKGD